MAETWTVLRLLTWCREYFTAKGIDTPRLDAEVLLAHVLGVDRLGLYLRYDQPLTPAELERFREIVKQRGQRVPVAHLVGTKEFFGLSYRTDKRALVPRPETELLVETVLAELPADEPLCVAEVGVGSGCVVVSLLVKRPVWTAVGTDISDEALNLTAENAHELQVAPRLELLAGDCLAGVTGPVAAVVSNPPYIPCDECAATMPEVAQYDPRAALDGGADGLDVIRRLIDQAPGVLDRGGLLALECGAGQAPAILALLAEDGRYRPGAARCDLAGIQRVVTARIKE
ncbi:MAG TPA: peptide chain release factor N(5)-glutamine methyltransferase [bacterium]|nr:peptide chain release factor N(5)-glutamine methyltransferase [bacterium]